MRAEKACGLPERVDRTVRRAGPTRNGLGDGATAGFREEGGRVGSHESIDGHLLHAVGDLPHPEGGIQRSLEALRLTVGLEVIQPPDQRSRRRLARSLQLVEIGLLRTAFQGLGARAQHGDRRRQNLEVLCAAGLGNRLGPS